MVHCLIELVGVISNLFWLYLHVYRSGNIKQTDPFDELVFQQNKNGQRMGNTIFSSGEFFVVSLPHDYHTQQCIHYL